MVDKGGWEEFRDRMIVYIDTHTVDVGMVVWIEIGFGREDTRDSDEGDDEDWVRDACGSPLEVMFTSCYRAEGWAEDWNIDKAS